MGFKPYKRKAKKTATDKVALKSIKNPFVDKMYMQVKKLTKTVAGIMPEKKVKQFIVPYGTNNTVSTVFTSTYPATLFSTIDLFPSAEGTTSEQFIGNSIRLHSYHIDLSMYCTDNSTQYCFLVFRWKQNEFPDAATWPNPLLGSGGSDGAGVNPFLGRPTKNDFFDTLYYRQGSFKTQPTYGTLESGNVLPVRIKKTIDLKQRVIFDEAFHNTYITNSIQSATRASYPSANGRIYWCIITDNFVNTDIGIIGNVRLTYTDS